MQPRMNVYLTTAKRVYKYAYPVILSLFAENTDSEIYLYIVSEDLEKSDIKEELSLAERFGNHIEILRFNEEMAKEKIVVAASDHWPLGTLGCYWLFNELLPSDVTKIMAIESDAIVTGSLREFYDTPFDGNYAVCPDAEHKPRAHADLMEEIGGDLLTFVPSLYNVEAIRRDFTVDDILAADKIGVKGLGHSQQELTFGVLFKNRIKFIPAPQICVEENSASLERFGIEYLTECEKTEKIIHFSSTGAKEKPWNPVYFMPGYEKWWSYAVNSPYYDFYIERQIEWQKNKDNEIQEIKKNISYKNILVLAYLIFFVMMVVSGVCVLHLDKLWIVATAAMGLGALVLSILIRRLLMVIRR